MSDQQIQPQIHKGLAGVVADATAISKVNPGDELTALPRLPRARAGRHAVR